MHKWTDEQGSHPVQVTVLLVYNYSMRLAAETQWCTCSQWGQTEAFKLPPVNTS